MPSISNSPSTMTLDSANKSNVINATLLRAWRERWDDAQWGTYIKSVLPKGVSGDAYDLADNIIQQAVVGSDANKLVLSYLRHSLCARQISHSSVIMRIAKFDGFDRPYCLIALLDFVDSIINGVTCRTMKEETSLPAAVYELLYWLTQVFATVLEAQFSSDIVSTQHQQILNILTKLLDKIVANQFIVANIFVAKQDNSELFKKLQEKSIIIKNHLNNQKCAALPNAKSIESVLAKLISVKLDGEVLERNKSLLDEDVETITYCLQPYIAVNVLLHPNCSTQNYASHLQMIQQLKKYPMWRVYSELIRSALISLHNVSKENDIDRESMWYAFTFIRVPHIIKQLNTRTEGQPVEYSPDVIKALDTLIDDPTLDYLDTTCGCNTIEYLLKELNKHNLINAQHVQQFASQRDPVMVSLSKMDINHQPSSIIQHLKKAESPLTGILKALDNDYNKMQEPGMLGMLCELLSGNNFELILSVATMEGQLKTFVSRLIRWNEKSRQVGSEAVDNTAMNRSALFDVTFLMLTFIVQTYGSHVVLDGNGDTFFEKWVRDFMIEKNRNKSAMSMVHQCEQSKVDEFLTSISSNDGSMAKIPNLRWHEICLILPGVLYQLLVAWENDTISASDVIVHLDNIKSRLCTYSVCAASWLCSYMQIVRDDELLKPLNMVQQFVTLNTTDDMNATNNIRERLNLTSQIIRKMQTDAHQNQKIRSPMMNIVSNQPLEEQFCEVWSTVSSRGWLSVKATQVLDNLLQSCGPYWLVSKMVNEIIFCKFSKDISKSMDIVFAVMHLNIQKCTVTLLSDILPIILLNKTQKFELIEPQLSVLARLCVYSIMSSLEKNAQKAKRTLNGNDSNDERPAKIRKMDDSLLEILSDGQEKAENVTNGGDNDTNSSNLIKIQEPLKGCLQDLFQTLYKLTFSSDLTPKVLFVHQFLTYLHRCGGETIMPVLNIIPSELMKNLLKITNGTSYNYDFVLRMYDLSGENGRKHAVTDLSLLQSIQLQNQNSIQF